MKFITDAIGWCQVHQTSAMLMVMGFVIIVILLISHSKEKDPIELDETENHW